MKTLSPPIHFVQLADITRHHCSAQNTRNCSASRTSCHRIQFHLFRFMAS